MSSDSTNRPDVRMRGFSERALVETALEWVDVNARPLDAESVDLERAHARILAEPITTDLDVPSFDRAAMDGYALLGAETDGAGDYNPISFSVVGESMPGQPFEGTVSPGQAVRIMTGSPLPDGADAVLPAEYANETSGNVEITKTVPPGKHVGRRGEDVKAGNTLLHAGRRLRPQDIGLTASVGIDRIAVVRHPRVRVLVTGNELVKPGRPRGTYQIYESNSSVLSGLIARDSAVLESLIETGDQRKAIREAMTAPGADILLISGGSSVGREDHAPSILAEEGELSIHGIAMRPSSPAGMGRIGSTLVFLLPGNPVSCLCAYDFFAGRAIRLMGGRTPDWPYPLRRLKLSRKIASAVGRVDYCRVVVNGDDVEPLALSGASILSSTSRADGFVIVPAQHEGYPPGANLDVFMYDPQHSHLQADGSAVELCNSPRTPPI